MHMINVEQNVFGLLHVGAPQLNKDLGQLLYF